jgi:hypothetical protein
MAVNCGLSEPGESLVSSPQTRIDHSNGKRSVMLFGQLYEFGDRLLRLRSSACECLRMPECRNSSDNRETGCRLLKFGDGLV